MAQYVQDYPATVTAAIGRFRAVILDTTKDKSASPPGAANAKAFGICQDEYSAADSTNGRVADIRVSGISTCVANSAISRGDQVRIADTTGRLETAAATTAKQYQVGIALTAAAAQGDWLEVLLTPGVQIDT